MQIFWEQLLTEKPFLGTGSNWTNHVKIPQKISNDDLVANQFSTKQAFFHTILIAKQYLTHP